MEQRMFRDLIESDTQHHGTRQGATMPVSAAIHAIIALLVVVVPILQPADLPEPGSLVKAFFVEPASAPAPPPPPPPPAPRAATTRVQPAPVAQNASFVAPIETPNEIAPEENADFGVEGGVPGGVEGGVPGGVVGGVVGGLPDAPPPTRVEAIRVGGQVKEPKKLKVVSPAYPDIAKAARVQGMVVLECTISPQGRVTNISVLRSIPLLDDAAKEAVSQWVYTPTLLNGVPVPVILTVTVNFQLK